MEPPRRFSGRLLRGWHLDREHKKQSWPGKTEPKSTTKLRNSQKSIHPLVVHTDIMADPESTAQSESGTKPSMMGVPDETVERRIRGVERLYMHQHASLASTAFTSQLLSATRGPLAHGATSKAPRPSHPTSNTTSTKTTAPSSSSQPGLARVTAKGRIQAPGAVVNRVSTRTSTATSSPASKTRRRTIGTTRASTSSALRPSNAGSRRDPMGARSGKQTTRTGSCMRPIFIHTSSCQNGRWEGVVF